MRQLSPAQQDELLDRLVGGDAVEFDPSEGVVVPAALVRKALATSARVEIRGATLDGELDLRHLSPAGGTAPGLRLERCTFPGPILLDGAHLGALSLAHSRLPLLSGVGLECNGRVVLDGIRPLADGGECRVELAEARIGGRVSAVGAHLVALPRPQKEWRQPTFIARYALCMRSAVCRSDVMLEPGLRAEGGVRLRRCQVEGSLWLGGATLVAGEGMALQGDGLRVGGRMSMGAVEGPGTLALFTARGPVDLEGVQVGETLALEGAQILPATEVPLPGPPGPGEGEPVEEGAGGMEVPLAGAPGTEDEESGVEEGAGGPEVPGPAEPGATEDPGDHEDHPPYLDLRRGAIGGDLLMGPVVPPDRSDAPPIRTRCPGSVLLDGLRVGGGAFLQSLVVQAPGGGGRVSGIGLETQGDLRLDVGEGAQRGDRILGPTLDALDLERATVGGSLYLLHARLGTRVGTGLPLDLWNVSVSGNLGITHCRIRGDVRLIGARVGRSLIVKGSHLTGVMEAAGLKVPSPGRLELNGSVLGSPVVLRQAEVGGKLQIRDVQIRGARWDDEVGLALSRARVEGELEVGGVRLSNAEREVALRALDGIVRFRKTRLACYPGWWLVEALLQVPLSESEDTLGDDCLLPGTIGFLVPDRRHPRERPVLLGGRSDAIHDFNRDGWLRLNHRWDSALDYLRFFPTYVSGERGASSFRIVEPGDPVLDQITVPEWMTIPDGVTLVPPRVERQGHSHFGRAAVAFGDGIYMADFRIDPDGSFTMLEDTPMGVTGEGERERMVPPFRLTRRRDEAFPPTVRGIARWGEYRWDTVLPDSVEGRCLQGGLRRALADFLPRILLENARIHTIQDQDGRGWGGGVRLLLDGLTYERVHRGGELDEALPGQENAAAGESPTDRIVSREEALDRWADALARWTGDGAEGRALRYRPLPWLEPWVLVELPLPHPRIAGERLAREGLADTFTLPFLWRDLEPGEAGRPVVLLQDMAGRPLRTFEGPLRPTVEGPEAAEAWARFLAEYSVQGPFRLDRRPPEGSPPESTEEWTVVPSHHPWSRRVCQDLLRFLEEVAVPPELDPLGLREAVSSPAPEAAGAALECMGWRQRWVARARAGAMAAWRASGITDSWDPVRVERRLRWLQLQFPGGEPNRRSFRPQPFEAAAAAFRSEGETEEARRILSYKLQTKLWLERRLAYRILGRLNYWFFDFGLSWGRALATVTLLWVVGWAATAYVNRTGLLVVALSPAATWAVPGPDGEGVAPGVRTGPSLGLASAGSLPDGVYTRVECGPAISAPIYALDLMIPILELGQRTRCDIASDLPPGEADGAGWWRSPALWSLLVPLYSILGALVVSMGLLTVSGVLRRRVES